MNLPPQTVSGPLLLGFNAVAGTLGLLLIKSALPHAPLPLMPFVQSLASVRFVAGFLLYGASFAAWVGVLALMPLSLAYPLAIGLTMGATTVAAAMLFGERIDTARLLGLACILVAVVLFNVGGRR